MCRTLDLSRSSYYAWLRKDVSAHARRDVELRGAILEEHLASRGICGAPRIQAMLRRRGIKVSRKRSLG